MSRTHILIILPLLLALNACSPVNRFTRVEKIPGPHVLNYCAGQTNPVPTSSINAEWIVFSDRHNNQSYREAGSNTRFKELEYLQPFVVLKKKNGFLKIARYDADNMADRKFKDRDEAEIMGWIHESRVLATTSASTNSETGFRHKYILTIRNFLPMEKPERFFDQDSVLVYADPTLRNVTGKASMYGIVYVMKWSEDRRQALISRTQDLDPEQVEDGVLGWVSGRVLQYLGQRMFMDLPARSDVVPSYLERHPVLNYQPVIGRVDEAEGSLIRTGTVFPVFDRSNNFVTNINGDIITYRHYQRITEDLRRINVFFVIEPGRHTLMHYHSIVNAIKELEPLFDDDDGRIHYRFSAVMTHRSQSGLQVEYTPPDRHYSRMLDTLITRTSETGRFSPIHQSDAWSGLRKAAEIAQSDSRHTNVIIHIGEIGSNRERPDGALVNLLARSNSRLLGLQIYSGYHNSYNNYVLQLTNMITSYAPRIAEMRQQQILYAELTTGEHAFVDMGNNSFRLDYPNRSMAQGGIVFTGKEQFLPPDAITAQVDTLMQQIHHDIDRVRKNLDRGFHTIGSQRDTYNQAMLWTFDQSEQMVVNHDLKSFFTAHPPGWWRTYEMGMNHDRLSKTDTYLLLSETAMDRTLFLLEQLSTLEMVIIEEYPEHRAQCVCPEELLQPVIDNTYVPNPEEMANIRYESTSGLRKDFRDILLSQLTANRHETRSRRRLQKLTLSEALETINGHSIHHYLLNNITINDLSDEYLLPDQMLAYILLYFEFKKEAIEKYLTESGPFTSNNETYYWLHSRYLP